MGTLSRSLSAAALLVPAALLAQTQAPPQAQGQQQLAPLGRGGKPYQLPSQQANAPVATQTPVAAPEVEIKGTKPSETAPHVDLAILLDTSNSMDGLINQARAQIWKIVTGMATAEKDGQTPQFRVALYEYGNSGLPSDGGWVRQVLPLTDDLDAVSEKLFALSTNGGDEYCGRVIEAAALGLEWGPGEEDLKVIVIAGNEPFTQGPTDYKAACKTAIEKGIVVNTIFCGPEQEGRDTGWADGATLADGTYAHIDQDQQVAEIETPFDKELAALSTKINGTYLAYGMRAEQLRFSENQTLQDANAGGFGGGIAATRAMAKASPAYANAARDVVDAAKQENFKLSDIPAENLPEELKGKSAEEQKKIVDEKSAEREKLQQQIADLSAKRSAYLVEERKKQAEQAGGEAKDSLDEAGHAVAERAGEEAELRLQEVIRQASYPTLTLPRDRLPPAEPIPAEKTLCSPDTRPSPRAAWLALAATADACFVHSPQPVQVWLDHVRIDVVNGIATKSYECGFKNPNGGEIVGGECYMELEPGAQIDGLSVSVDGTENTADVLTVDEANKVFTKIVSEGGTPALLEYYGNQLIRTKLPRVGAGKTVVVKLRYTMPLKKAGDLYRISCLNTNPKSLATTLKSASVTVRIKSDEPVQTVYSPTHEITTFEEEGWDVGVKWAAENYTPLSAFQLYFRTAPGESAASVLAHRQPGEDGSFLMILSPTHGVAAADLTSADVLPKDVVFCVDASGSMLADGKMEQAKKGLHYCVSQLRPGDRFNIVAFGTSVKPFRAEGLAPADEAQKKAASNFIDSLAARGGTAMDGALKQSFAQLAGTKAAGTTTGASRMPMLVFMTDGLPTIGERDPAKILSAAKAANADGVRLFVFGEGFDVNAALLDALAREHQGEADYITPKEKIDERVAAFFNRVGSPVLTDVKVEIDGLEVEDLFPQRLPDLFLGEQLMLVGRYRGYGKKTVTLTGSAGGMTKTHSFEVSFPEFTDESADFVPRLWAGRKIDAMLTALRGREKADPKAVAEITELATRFGIVTPYTGFLLKETDEKLADAPVPGGAGFGAPIGNGPGPRPRPMGAAGGMGGGGGVAGRLQLEAAEPMNALIREQQVRGAREVAESRPQRRIERQRERFLPSGGGRARFRGREEGPGRIGCRRPTGRAAGGALPG